MEETSVAELPKAKLMTYNSFTGEWATANDHYIRGMVFGIAGSCIVFFVGLLGFQASKLMF